jgi:hypothetical protein
MKVPQLPHWIYVCIVALIVSSAQAQVLQPYTGYVPQGVSLGMTVEQFRTSRPSAAVAMGVSSRLAETDQNFDFVEEVSVAAPFLHIFYKFKGRSLRAFWWSYGGDQVATVASGMRTQMLAGFTKEGDDTVKVIVDGQKVTVPLELWRSSDGTRKAYLVAPTTALQLLVFDPSTVTKADLFDDVDAIE